MSMSLFTHIIHIVALYILVSVTHNIYHHKMYGPYQIWLSTHFFIRSIHYIMIKANSDLQRLEVSLVTLYLLDYNTTIQWLVYLSKTWCHLGLIGYFWTLGMYFDMKASKCGYGSEMDPKVLKSHVPSNMNLLNYH